MTAVQQIRCESCGRWIARIEQGKIVIPCPRCKADHPVEVTTMIQFLENWLIELRAEQDQLGGVMSPVSREPTGAVAVPGRLRPFG